ncbi:MAG: hypothetical protein ABR526_02630 [Chthoniobacterales bacterium]
MLIATSMVTRPQAAGDLLHQPRFLSQSHHAEPHRHHADETKRNCHGRLRAIERAIRNLAQLVIPPANRDGEQDEREPDVV